MLDKILSLGKSAPDYTVKLSRFAQVTSREKVIRGFGVALILIALFLQVFAAITPHKISAAASPNDLIPGGVSSKAEMVADCRANTNHIDKILDYYGISCADMSKGDVVTINSRDYNDRFYSVGHLAYGFASETPVTIGDETFYWRLLHAWDTGNSSTYTALKFTNAAGKTFWALFTCGNLVHINIPNPYRPPPPPCPYNPAIPASSAQCKPPPKPCPYNPQLPSSSAQCKPCADSSSQYDALACLVYHKTVTNVTRSVADANGTTAKPGDVLKYTLTVTNGGKLTATKFVIKDSISDILEYADLTNSGGGTLGSDGYLSYPKVNIAPGKTVTETFSVTVKNPLPTTPPSANDPQAYNNTMTNVFGDTINVKVQPPTTQVIVSGATNLPNTGPGTSMVIYAVIASIAGYFYYNRRLQLKEARIALDLASAEEVA